MKKKGENYRFKIVFYLPRFAATDSNKLYLYPAFTLQIIVNNKLQKLKRALVVQITIQGEKKE